MMKSPSLVIPGFMIEESFISHQDYDFLNLFELAYKNDDYIYAILKNKVRKYQHIVAYSLGGRLLLSNYHIFSQVDHIDLIACHPGNFNEIQRLEAKKNYEDILAKLEQLSLPAFISWWNNLELFKYDQKINSSRSKEDIVTLFKKWPAYLQNDTHQILLKSNIKNIIMGEFDTKYQDVFHNLPSRNKNMIVKGTSHRCISSQLLGELRAGFLKGREC